MEGLTHILEVVVDTAIAVTMTILVERWSKERQAEKEEPVNPFNGMSNDGPDADKVSEPEFVIEEPDEVNVDTGGEDDTPPPEGEPWSDSPAPVEEPLSTPKELD